MAASSALMAASSALTAVSSAQMAALPPSSAALPPSQAALPQRCHHKQQHRLHKQQRPRHKWRQTCTEGGGEAVGHALGLQWRRTTPRDVSVSHVQPKSRAVADVWLRLYWAVTDAKLRLRWAVANCTRWLQTGTVFVLGGYRLILYLYGAVRERTGECTGRLPAES
eukprot:1385318-Rhodomonas_salina.1